VLLAPELVERLVHRVMLAAQLDRGRREPREVFALDLAPDPPVGIVALPEPLERLARAREVVEVAPTHRELDRRLDCGDPLLARRPPRRAAVVLRCLAVPLVRPVRVRHALTVRRGMCLPPGRAQPSRITSRCVARVIAT